MDPMFSVDVIDDDTSQVGRKRRRMVRVVAISMSAMMADSIGRCAAYHVVYVQEIYVVPATRPLLCCQYLVASKVFRKNTHPSQNMWITVAIFLLLCLCLYVAVDCVCSSLKLLLPVQRQHHQPLPREEQEVRLLL